MQERFTARLSVRGRSDLFLGAVAGAGSAVRVLDAGHGADRLSTRPVDWIRQPITDQFQNNPIGNQLVAVMERASAKGHHHGDLAGHLRLVGRPWMANPERAPFAPRCGPTSVTLRRRQHRRRDVAEPGHPAGGAGERCCCCSRPWWPPPPELILAGWASPTASWPGRRTPHRCRCRWRWDSLFALLYRGGAAAHDRRDTG